MAQEGLLSFMRELLCEYVRQLIPRHSLAQKDLPHLHCNVGKVLPDLDDSPIFALYKEKRLCRF